MTQSPFQENLDSFKRLFPDFAKKLELVDEKDVLQRKESIQPSFANCTVLYIFGISIEAYQSSIQDWLRQNKARYCIFLENDLHAIYNLINNPVGKMVLNDPQCFLFPFESEHFPDSLAKELSELFCEKVYSVNAIDLYISEKKETLTEIETKLSMWNTVSDAISVEYKNFGAVFFNNYYTNLRQLPNAYQGDKLLKQFNGIPAIICGAGPSLDKNLHVLETLSDKALIFAGGTAMNAVNSNGFVPHFGVGIDPNMEQFTRLVMNTAYEVPYFYRNRLYSKVLPLLQGPLLFVPGSAGYHISEWLEEKLNIPASAHVDEGFNVVNFSMDLARLMGCNPIILVGVDLSYSNQHSYQAGVKSHPTNIYRKDFRTKHPQDELLVKDDIFGNPTFTLWKWISESYWISNFSQKSEALVINATEGGIGMNNVPNLPLHEVEEKLLLRNFDLDLMIHGEIQNSHMPDNVTKEAILNLSNELMESLEKCQGYYDQLMIKESDDILEKLHQEIGYRYILKSFEEHFSQLMMLPSYIDKKEKREDNNKFKLYRYLKDGADANLLFIKFSILFEEILDKLPVKQAPVEKDTQYDAFIAKNVIPPISTFYPDGAIKQEQFYLDGVLEGPSSFFSAKGDLLGRSYFSKGKKEGKSTLYYNSNALYAELNFKNGLKEGEWRYYFSDGKIKSIIPYKEGQLDGTVLLYFPNGKLKRQLSFSKGARHGKEQLWSQSGILQLEANFSNNLPQGMAKTWYPNGLIAQEITYKDGKAILIQRWDTNGLLIPDEKVQEKDFFDQVAVQTQVFSDSLGFLCTELNKLLPLMAPSKENFQTELETLSKEFQNLQKINEALHIETGLKQDDQFLEAIWKTPAIQKELTEDLKNATDNLMKELDNIQTLFNQIKEKK